MAIPAIDTGLIRVVTNAQLSAAEADEARQRAIEQHASKPVLQGLAAYVMTCWHSARDAKRPVANRLLEAQLARLGKYSNNKLRAIREIGGSEEYARVTSNKCRVAESWLRDVYIGQSEKPWTLKHSPNPELPQDALEEIKVAVSQEIAEAFLAFGEPPPPDMIQSRKNELQDAVTQRLREEARIAIERMGRKMEDQLVEGGWELEWGRFLNDIVTYPAAHFKGPVFRKRRVVKWVQEGAEWKPVTSDEIRPFFERLDAFRAFPSPNSTDPQEGYFIEHVTFSRGDLHDLIGVDGFDEDAIRAVLQDYGRGGLTNWLGFHDIDDQERELDGQDRDKGPLIDIDGLEYHGPVRGRDLLDWGLDAKEIPDPDDDYEACVWLIGSYVIKAQLNYDPTQTRPYFKVCWEEIPGSYWGLGLVDALADVQNIVNAAVRALVNNMALASGPQVEINVDRMPPGESISTLVPWKIWQTQDSPYGNPGQAMQFFQPSMNSAELMSVIEKFYQFADDWSLIPRYMSGNDRVGGAGRTASGLSMLLNAANKGLKGIVSTVDANVLSPMLRKLYTFNMLFDEDDSIKGDAEVMARGAISLMQLETLQLRRNEFLQATANAIDSQIVGPEGRAEILREVAKGLEMDVNRIVPRRGEVMGGQGLPATPGAPQGTPTPSGGAIPPPGMAVSDEQLMTGGAVTDNFSPNAMTPQ
jgi:hypothetical protein